LKYQAKSILNASSKHKDIAGRGALFYLISEFFGTNPLFFVDCNTTAAGI
jgi:hypothetical protein